MAEEDEEDDNDGDNSSVNIVWSNTIDITHELD